MTALSKIAVLHIPHSSGEVPAEERQAICLADGDLDRELQRMTDAYTDDLFPVTYVEAGRVVFPMSRLICDVERFPSDENEPMAARGMGVFYTRTSMGTPFRHLLSPQESQILLDRWYWPHHRKLQILVDEVTARFGRCLIVDCHSFPSVALPYELNQNEHRADICIGTDPFHTPVRVRDSIQLAVKAANWSVAVDAPFAGALVPLAVYRKDRRFSSAMIEVNRRLYMDEQSGTKKTEFEKVRKVVGELIVRAAEALMQP
jgi:N-formylglutamate amidohydrolase